MKNSIVILVSVLCFLLFPGICSGQDDDSYEAIKEAFIKPPSEARPKVYWWCLNGNIDTVRAKQEFMSMKETGITGFDLFEIGVPKQDTMIPGGPAFMSDESVKTIKWAVEEAGKLGLTVGLNLASSWNAGGAWVKPEHGGKSLYVSEIGTDGNIGKKKIILPFPEISFPEDALIGGTDQLMIPYQGDGRPVYYEEVAVLAIPVAVGRNNLDTTQIIDLTPYFDPRTEELDWEAPDGDWVVRRYVCSNSGQQLVLPSPRSAGLTIDHFDSTAVETHLMYIINRLRPVLGDFRTTALKSFYLASYEARGFVWTSTLPEKFEEVNGYEITKFIPVLFNEDLFSVETNHKVQTDFKKTLSELMINNLYKKSKEICNSYGLKINCEAGGPGYPLYNGPAEPLKALGSLDIPRGEFWINHSRFYKDGNDSIDILRVVKEVSAASHIYEKGIVEEEAFTSFQHWQEGPFDMKPYGDRAFCEGMNRVVFHGFSHNISGSGFPGYVYHAGTHFNDKRAWWAKAKPFVDYLSRISAVFQETNFVADVLWYYGDKVPNSATPKNARFKVGEGYDYEVINTEILINNLSVQNGKLILANGAVFSMLALENEESIHPAVLEKLNKLAQEGAMIVGERPEKVKQMANMPVSGRKEDNLIEQLWHNVKDPSRLDVVKSDNIYSGISPKQMLEILNVPPDMDYPGKESELLDFIHFEKGDVHLYFVRNTTGDWLSRTVSFRQQNKVPELWNPVSGEIVPVTIFNPKTDYISLPLTFSPYGSNIIAFKNGRVTPHFTDVTGTGQHPPLFEFSSDGVQFLQDGQFKLKGQTESISVENPVRAFTLEGAWDITFTTDWGAPERVTFPELISWTDSKVEGVKYYSGTARYKKVFQYNDNINQVRREKLYLDLGEVSKVAEVWLNGEHLGIVWAKPYRFDVTDLLKQGENTIVVEVANTWSNRLTGDALTGGNYTNTNISNTVIPVSPFESGDQTRLPWVAVPLIESGLLGPVSVRRFTEVRYD